MHTTSKATLRGNLDAAINGYLQSGGEIQRIPTGAATLKRNTIRLAVRGELPHKLLPIPATSGDEILTLCGAEAAA